KSGFKVFGLPELELIHEETNLPAGDASMALSPSGKYLALGYMGGTVQIWNLDQKKLVASWAAHEPTGLVYWPVAFAPDGKSLATGNKSTIKIWDLTGGSKSPERSDTELILGAWRGVAAEVGGEAMPQEFIDMVKPTLTFSADKATAGPQGKVPKAVL